MSKWEISILIICSIILQSSCKSLIISNNINPEKKPNSNNLYDQQGADWPGLCGTGTLQSPIEIDSNSASDVHRGLPIVFVNYGQCGLRGQAGATTLGLTMEVENGLDVGIAAGGLRGFYKLDSAHFHWEAEHIVDKKRPALELHLVHYKDVYSGVAEAKKHPNGLAVIGVLYKIGEADDGIAKLIKSMENEGNLTTANEFLPNDISEYFRYSGSLTTPDCAESVVWTVLKTQKTISEDQLGWFRRLPMKDGFPIENNYRVIQKTRRRKVYNVLASYV